MKLRKEGSIIDLVREERAIQCHIPKSHPHGGEQQLVQSFIKLIYQGKSHAALHRASGTGRAGQATARPIFWRILVLFVLYTTTTTPQYNKIHTAHVGGEINLMSINKISQSMLFRFRRPCYNCWQTRAKEMLHAFMTQFIMEALNQ